MRITKNFSKGMFMPSVIILLLAAIISLKVGASAAPTGTLFPVGGRNFGVITGPDNSLWFTKNNITPNTISKMTLDGTVTDYPLSGSVNQQVMNLVYAPDGNVWFVETAMDKIGKITPSGTITEYDAPDPSNSVPFGLTVGPDNNLWFMGSGANYAGKIDVDTGSITKYDLTYGTDQFGFITTGPDNNLWFTDITSGKIIRLSTNGSSQSYSLSNPSALPIGIISGPDGNLWFTEQAGNKVGKISTSGQITEYDIPTPNAGPFGITVGPDQNIWVSESAKMSLLKITSTGTMEEYDYSSISNTNYFISSLALGPDGELWASDSDGTSSLIQFTGFEHVSSNNSGGGSGGTNTDTPNSPKTGVGLVALMLVMTALCAGGYEVARSLSKKHEISKRSNK